MDLLPDTSVLIDTLRGHNGRKELLARLVEDGHRLSTTALNVAERSGLACEPARNPKLPSFSIP